MACLEAMVSRIGGWLDATSERIGGGLVASVESSVEHISALALSVSGLIAEVEVMGERLQASCSVVCSVGGDPVYYVRVSPEEVQWITDDMGVFFDVESNTEWIVEKS